MFCSQRGPLELTYSVLPRGSGAAWAEPVTSRPEPANGTEAATTASAAATATATATTVTAASAATPMVPAEPESSISAAAAVATAAAELAEAEAAAAARKLARKRDKEQRRKHKHHRKRSKSKSMSLEPMLTTEPTDDVMKLKLKITPAFTALRLHKEAANAAASTAAATRSPPSKTPNPDQESMSNLQTLSDAAVRIRSLMGTECSRPATAPQSPPSTVTKHDGSNSLRVAAAYPNTLANLKPNLCLRNIPNPSVLLQRHRQHHAT